MIINRNEAIAARQDPFGKVWGIRLYNKENSFWCIGYKGDNGDYVIPTTYPHPSLEGKFTRQHIAQEAIHGYLTSSWDMADEETKKQERRDRPKAKEVVGKAVSPEKAVA